MNQDSIYQNPLIERYASKEISQILSNEHKYITWRKLWLALAKAEQKAGLNITSEQIQDLEDNLHNLNVAEIKKYEEELQHEVMAHIKGYASVCKVAAPIIHLGETSAFVLDNADIIIAKDALNLVKTRVLEVIKNLSIFVEEHKSVATLSFTHLQPAQPITLGKRATLWLNSLVEDYKRLKHLINDLKIRGVKGTTGSAASFYKLLNGDYSKLKLLEQEVAKELGFKEAFLVTSQTYDRKIDVEIAHVLNQIAVSAHKISNDLRLLQNMGEVEEPFREKQVGSSAMPYKKNPMLGERVSSLAKFIMSLTGSASLVASTQWLERTLDDSANKRLTLPQAFLATDSVLLLLNKIISGMVVKPKVIQKNLNQQLPFMICENILMEFVKKGGSRQKGHEIIRNYAIEAKKRISEEGLDNNLIDLIKNDKELNFTEDEINKLSNPKELVGFCEQQVEDFLQEVNKIITAM